MAAMLDITGALAKLASKVESSEYPTLSDTELAELLDEAALAVLYAAGTVYGVGDRIVVPAPLFNGRCYRCIIGGTSAAAGDPSAPCWPQHWGIFGSRYIEDGLTGLRWEDDGAAYPQLWDIDLAVHNGWIKKAGKLVRLIDVADASEKLTLSQIRDNCLSQASLYSPAWVG